jgi:hypothetical protein
MHPTSKYHVPVHILQLLDHETYKNKDKLGNILVVWLGMGGDIGAAPFHDGDHSFFGSRVRSDLPNFN